MAEAIQMAQPAHRESGQALIALLATSVILIVSLVAMFNVGRHSTEKTVLVNAADAVAFSGASLYARSLNFNAYTNRAMIATNIGMAHAISYMSWIRYLNDVQRAIDAGETLPPEFTPLLATMNLPDVLAEAEVHMKALSSWSGFLQEVYQVSQSGLFQVPTNPTLASSVEAAMERVACRHEPNFYPDYYTDLLCARSIASAKLKVNHTETLNRMLSYTASLGETQAYNKLVQADWATQAAALDQFSQMMTPSGAVGNNLDNARMYNLVLDTLSVVGGTNWIFNRTWNSSGFNKNGTAVFTADLGTITSSDTIDSGGPSLATGIVSSEEYLGISFPPWVANPITGDLLPLSIHAGYSGIQNYRHLPDADDTTGPENDSLTITAFVSIELEDRPMTFRPYIDDPILPDGSAVLTAVAQAQVFYQRPTLTDGIGFAPLNNATVEYANLYNPFWHAKLVN